MSTLNGSTPESTPCSGFQLPEVNTGPGGMESLPERRVTAGTFREDAERLLRALEGEQECQGRQDCQGLEQEESGSLSSWTDTRLITENVSWAWPQWLPNGFLTMIAAESGQGKSILALWIAGLFTSGRSFPNSDHGAGRQGSVLWIETEHAQAMNLDRAAKFGLDDSKFLNPLSNPLDTVQLENSDHRKRVMEAALHPEVSVIVIDSLSGAHRMKENGTEMIEITDFLAEVAQACNKPVIVIHHFNKLLTDGNVPALGKVRGSSSIVQFCRVVWAVDAPDLQDPSMKRLSVIKSNLGEFPEPIGFMIEDDRITFTDAPEGIEKSIPRLEEAKIWLRERMAEGPVPSNAVFQEARQEGISKRTLDRAKIALNYGSRPINGVWYFVDPSQGRLDQKGGSGGELGNLGILDGNESTGQPKGEEGEE